MAGKHAARALAELELTLALTEQLGSPLPEAGWKLLPYAANITPPPGVVVMLAMGGVVPDPDAGRWARTYRFTVTVLTGATSSPGADDVVDEAMEHVTRAIDHTDSLLWSDAERVAYGDALAPAYQITATVAATVNEE
jgi:hypothetical protein